MRILTNRNVATWPSYQIVWEWEDSAAKALGAELAYESRLPLNKYARALNLFQHSFLPKGHLFVWEVSVSRDAGTERRYNRENIIPCVVDYFFKDEEMSLFEKKFDRNPLVFISSKEVYDRLMSQGCKTKIAHLPLTISDIYALNPDTVFEKKYDLIMMGRQNPVQKEYLNIYIKSHPDFVYVYEDVGMGKLHYRASDGQYVGYIETREKYMSLLRQSRVALYSTPGIDGGEVRTNGFNQVTPKFLEYLACGCNVISRWKDNPDTDFYGLHHFSENVDDYKIFERLMDEARTKKVEVQAYSEYLKGHYTSSIVPTIKSYTDKVFG